MKNNLSGLSGRSRFETLILYSHYQPGNIIFTVYLTVSLIIIALWTFLSILKISSIILLLFSIYVVVFKKNNVTIKLSTFINNSRRQPLYRKQISPPRWSPERSYRKRSRSPITRYKSPVRRSLAADRSPRLRKPHGTLHSDRLMTR